MCGRAVRKEGAITLWSGIRPTLIMALPSTAIYYTAYDELKGELEARNEKGSMMHSYAPALAGGAARTAAAAVTSPLELVRTKMQAARSTGTTLQALRWELRCGCPIPSEVRCVSCSVPARGLHACVYL